MNTHSTNCRWNSVPLHCLSLIIKGVTYAKEDIGVSGEGYIPILRANNIQSDELDFHNLVWVCEERISKEQLLCLGDVVVATSSGSKHLVGKTASFRGEQKISCGAFCAILRPNSLINNLFFKYFFQTQSYRNHISSLAKGSNINNLKNADLANVQVPVPPLAEQKRIVKKIEELFGIIDKTVKYLNDTKQHLAQYRQSVLQQAFSGKLHKTTVWSQNSLNDLCKYIQRGKSPKYITHSTLPVINQKCIRWNELQIQYLKFIDPVQFESWIRERHVQPMDILWNSTGTGTIGRAYLYQGTELEDAVVDSHVTIVRADAKKINPNFLFFYIQSPFIQRKIEKMQSGSTNQVELARKEIQNIQVNLPSLPEQKAIVAKIETAFAAADKAERAISAALEQAKQLKQSILKRAFEGKLVPQDPNDEPVDLSQLNTHKGKSK